MLVINFETIKEKINDYYISAYYIADNIEHMLRFNDWGSRWNKRRIKYSNEVYADFDVLDYVFHEDSKNLQYLTWVDSNFGKIENFLEFFKDFYVSKEINRLKMLDNIEKAIEKGESIFLFDFAEISKEVNKKEMI